MLRQKMKKLTGGILAAALLAGTMVGCGAQEAAGVETVAAESKSTSQSDGAQTAASEVETEQTSFTIAVFKHALSKAEDFNDMEAFKMAEEATGVHIDWIYVSDGAAEKTNTMLTADLPDAFLGLLDEKQVAANLEALLDLNKDQLLEKYAPHVYSDYQKATSENVLESLQWPDGSIRTLLTGPEVSYQDDAQSIMMINKVWLDQLGLEVPETTEELYEVLKAFRDNDMNGNGDTTDEIPLELCEANWAGKYMNLANPWGIASPGTDSGYYYMVKDGKAEPTLDRPEFRSYLEFMNQLMSEGLLDKEMFTQTNDQYYAKLKTGTVGCWTGWTAYSVMGDELAEQYVPMRVVQAKQELTPVKTGQKDAPRGNRTGFVITRDCEEPERLLAWWDYLSSSTEIKYTMRYGPQGEYWDIDENGTVYQKTPAGLKDDFTVENFKYTYGLNGNCTFILKEEDIEIGKEEAFTTWVRSEMVDKVWDQMQTEYTPRKFVDSAKISERTFLETELVNYVQNFTATAIMEGVDDAAWEAYLEQLKTLQYYEWIDWWQGYLDGTL